MYILAYIYIIYIYLYVTDGEIIFDFGSNSTLSSLTKQIDNEITNLTYKFKLNITSCDRGEI